MAGRLVVGAMWLLATAGALSVAYAGASVQANTGTSGFDAVFLGLALAGFMYASMGALLVLRRPANVIGVAMLLVGLLIALTFNGYAYGASLTLKRGSSDLLAGYASLAGALGIGPAILGAGPLIALLFPDGRLPWRWLRQASWFIGAALVAIEVTAAVTPGPVGDSLAENPIGVDLPLVRQAGQTANAAFGIVVLAALALAFAAVVARFRRAGGVERQQLKWFVAANVLVVASVSASVVDGAAGPTLADRIAPLSMALPPIAVAVAVLRYRLYEIDRLISRSLSWAVVSALLVGTFVSSVVALQALLAGVTQGGTLAVAASTLLAFALFQPFRRRVQAAVDRRFDRAHYDGQRLAERFAERVRAEVDLLALRLALVQFADGAVRPDGAAVWLRTSAQTRP